MAVHEVNYADGTLFAGDMLCPIAAGLAATSARAGWFTIVFVAAAVPVGFAVFFIGTKLTYPIAEFGLRLAERMKPWVQSLVFGPFFLFYFIFPQAVSATGILGTWYATIWLARHIS